MAMGLALLAAPVMAQDQGEEVADEQEEAAAEDQEVILVSGSRIRRPNLESNVPVTSVTAEDLLSQGDVNIGDALNDLPSLRSTFSQANSTRFIGTTGLNLLDLRGLGTSRTLVLVNGRRHVTSTIGDFDVDVNTIPSDLLERVDVITGGSSAVYGSDAVAGVVNFVLRRDFEGVKLRGQTGISSRGDRGIQSVSLTAGQNFADGRINLAANLEYTHADQLRFPQRDELTGAFSGRNQFNASEFTIGEPAAGDGVPDLTFFSGVRNVAISDGGTLTALASAAQCQSAAFGPGGASAAIGAARCLNPGTPFGQPRFFNFDTAGNLLEQIPALDFRPFGSGNYIAQPGASAPGSTLNNTGQLAPELDRYIANLLFNFDVSDAFQLFAEAKYVHIDNIQEGQPSFFQGTFPGFFGGGRGIRCDNPFLTAQNITTLQTVGRCAGGATSTETLPLGRFNVDFGARQQFIERDTYRIVGGIRGDFNDDWNYELSVNYGRYEESVDAANDLVIFDIDGDGNIVAEGPFLNAIDSVRNGAGQIVCRINADADPTNDDPACVPINPFGFGQPSAAALDYVNTTSNLSGNAEQLNIVGYVNGDLSQLFELPGGPVRFVVGGEYRRESAFQEADELSSAGATFFNAFAVFDPPALEVFEVFGEVEIPLLANVPFFEELTVTGAARYSDYNSNADKTFAWNANLVWSPIDGVRLRGNYSRSVRVPTLGDLFTPDTQNFAFIADPCDAARINNGSPTRAANCAALGVPAGFVNTIANSQTTEIISSGNPFLQEESSDSWTVGGVLTPNAVRGLSFSVDYYNITVDNLIAVLGGQVIVNQCVDLPSIDNQFCELIFPRLADGSFDSPALRSGGVNFARLEAEGIDFELAFQRRFDSGWRINTRAILTYVLNRTNFTSPTDPEFGTPVLQSLGDPEYSANFNATIGKGPFDLRYSVNFIGRQLIAGSVETYFGFQGRPATNPDLTAEVYYPDTYYHSLRLSVKANENFEFFAGVDNLLDTQPPLGLLGTAGGDPFDSIGRYFFAGAVVTF
jgi:outer membrane receptor protein involved in Fe transport